MAFHVYGNLLLFLPLEVSGRWIFMCEQRIDVRWVKIYFNKLFLNADISDINNSRSKKSNCKIYTRLLFQKWRIILFDLPKTYVYCGIRRVNFVKMKWLLMSGLRFRFLIKAHHSAYSGNYCCLQTKPTVPCARISYTSIRPMTFPQNSCRNFHSHSTKTTKAPGGFLPFSYNNILLLQLWSFPNSYWKSETTSTLRYLVNKPLPGILTSFICWRSTSTWWFT